MLIRDKLLAQEEMTELEATIATYFLEHGRAVEQASSRSIAATLYVSPSTISRFCQLLGYKGFSDFKVDFLEELTYLDSHFEAIDPNFPFTVKDKNLALAYKIGALYQETVADSLSLLHHDSLQAAIRLLTQAPVIYLISAGDSSDLAQLFKNKLLKIGKTVLVESRMDNAYHQAACASEDSCFIILSYSGTTSRVIKVAELLHKRQLPLIALTSFGTNPLSELATVTLYLSTRERLVDNLGSFSSLLSTSLLLDVLYASIFQDNYDTNYQRKVANARTYETKRTSDNPLLKD